MTTPAEDKYARDADAVYLAIVTWHEVHPGANPRFKFPPRFVIVSGVLQRGLEHWTPNDEGRDLVNYVDAATDRQATMLMFQVALTRYYQRCARVVL